MALTPAGMAYNRVKRVVGGEKGHPKRRVGTVVGGLACVLAVVNSCHSDPTNKIKNPGIAQLDYSKLTIPQFKDGEFGGLVKGVKIKHNEHTKNTPSALDRTYTLSMTPGVTCYVSVDLKSILNTPLKKSEDGKIHIPITSNPDDSKSDVHLTCDITNPTKVNAHANGNMLAKAIGGLSGVANVLPQVNLDNPINRNSPMIGIGELQAINNFARTCGPVALRQLTDVEKPDNIQNDIKQNVLNFGVNQLANKYNVGPNAVKLTKDDFKIDFHVSNLGLPTQYDATMKQIEQQVKGLSFPGALQMPPCVNNTGH